MPEIELAYAERKPARWYQHRWVYRLVILLAILWVGRTAIQTVRPFWYRYRYYRLEQQAKGYRTASGLVAFRHSATQPYALSTVPADPFYVKLWAARSNAGCLPNFFPNRFSTETQIFCGLLRDSAGNQNMVEIFLGTQPTTASAYLGMVPKGPIPPTGLEVATLELLWWKPHTWKWIFDADASNGGFGGESLVQVMLLPSDTLIEDDAQIDPNDPAVADIRIILNRQPLHLRFHIVNHDIPAFEAPGLPLAPIDHGPVTPSNGGPLAQRTLGIRLIS